MLISAPVSLSANPSGFTFTGLAANPKFLALALAGVACSINGDIRVRLGIASGLVATGYDSQSNSYVTTQAFGSSTVDFVFLYQAGVQQPFNGNILFMLTDPPNFNWNAAGQWASRTSSYTVGMTGRVAIGGPLTQLRLYPGGSATFVGGKASLISGS